MVPTQLDETRGDKLIRKRRQAAPARRARVRVTSMLDESLRQLSSAREQHIIVALCRRNDRPCDCRLHIVRQIAQQAYRIHEVASHMLSVPCDFCAIEARTAETAADKAATTSMPIRSCSDVDPGPDMSGRS